MILLIDARKACKALEGFRIKKDVFESNLSDWEYGYNCGLERAEDEIQDFIVEAIPIEWIENYLKNYRYMAPIEKTFVREMIKAWTERKEE